MALWFSNQSPILLSLIVAGTSTAGATGTCAWRSESDCQELSILKRKAT
jgi:hypothetical protein